jgi:hypothetical protein
MAPPRTSNSTRQAPKKSQKHTDKDMDASDNIDPMDVDDQEQDEPSTTSAQELIANMVEGVSAEALHLHDAPLTRLILTKRQATQAPPQQEA